MTERRGSLKGGEDRPAPEISQDHETRFVIEAVDEDVKLRQEQCHGEIWMMQSLSVFVGKEFDFLIFF